MQRAADLGLWLAHGGLATGLEEALEYWARGGWLLVPLGVVAFLIWHVYFLGRGRLRSALASPRGWEEDLEARLRTGQGGEDGGRALERWLAGLPGAGPRIARRVLGSVGRGLGAREAFARCRDAEMESQRHTFQGLGALVAAAPLLGLLGTVLGMVETFDGLAGGSWETSEQVAAGIGRALVTTQIGLLAALPGTFGLAHLARLERRLRHRLEAFGVRLVRAAAPEPARGRGRGGGR